MSSPFAFDFKLSDEDLQRLEDLGVDMNMVRRFVRDGIGNQVGFHMHDGSKLFDYDIATALGGPVDPIMGRPAALGIGLLVQFLTGPSSISIPVKDAKAVDTFLEECDRFILKMKSNPNQEIARLFDFAEFYRVPLPPGHSLRCAVMKIFGLKWRLYWGRIGSGLYIAHRPFVLEDIAAAQAGAKKSDKPLASGHALLRMLPENWTEVLPGYNQSWEENRRSACLANLSMLANVNRGWNDRGSAETPALLGQVIRMYGVRPFCPDGGAYSFAPDGKSCRCSIHGDDRNPRQFAAPADNSATGKLLKTLAGLNATLTFQVHGLRAVVTIERKE
ncbi:MAG TPA: hypothetical protein VGZ47_16265 [Gemmataceae bacterium]|jgi:hypothetical protein|nr:hypothetical protein [Gemmataceae bacterium]